MYTHISPGRKNTQNRVSVAHIINIREFNLNSLLFKKGPFSVSLMKKNIPGKKLQFFDTSVILVIFM